jgi:hypothetical protein
MNGSPSLLQTGHVLGSQPFRPSTLAILGTELAIVNAQDRCKLQLIVVLAVCTVNDSDQAAFLNRRDCDRGISKRFSQRNKTHPESSGKKDVLKQSELLKHCYGQENAFLSSLPCKQTQAFGFGVNRFGDPQKSRLRFRMALVWRGIQR